MGESGRSTKKNFEQGKVKWKKIHVRQLIQKKYSCYGLKKIHSRNLITKKIPAARKFSSSNSPPSHNGPSLNILGRFHTFFHLRVVLRQLFDTVKGKYQKSKEIATDSNLIWDVMLYSRHSWALHLPLETTCSCKQGTKVRYWQTELTRPVKVDHLQSWSRIF